MMGRQSRTEKNAQHTGTNIVAVRFSSELLTTLDRAVEQRKKTTPWQEVTRADLIREAVYKLLEPSQLPTNLASAGEAQRSAHEPSANNSCRICKRPLTEGRKALCGREECLKEDKNARERERRRALREAQK